MTPQAKGNEEFDMKEVWEMETFKDHDEIMRAFRQSHVDIQAIVLVEVESFEAHDERMKVFHRNHSDISKPIAKNAGGKRNIPNEDEWSVLAQYKRVTGSRFSSN